MKPSPAALALALALVLPLFSSCAIQRLKTRVYSPSTSDAVVDISFGGVWSPNYRYTVDGIHASREVYEPHTDKRTSVTSFRISKQQEVAPTEAQWAAFWQNISMLRIGEWRRTYHSDEIGEKVCDGTQWHLKYSRPGSERVSTGDNGYPVVGKPSRGTLESTSFDELIASLDRLFPTPMKDFAGY